MDDHADSLGCGWRRGRAYAPAERHSLSRPAAKRPFRGVWNVIRRGENPRPRNAGNAYAAAGQVLRCDSVRSAQAQIAMPATAVAAPT